MAATLTREQIEESLRKVIDPEIGRDIVSLGMVRDLTIDGTHVEFTLVLTTAACPLRAQMQHAAQAALLAVPGVETAVVKVGANSPRGSAEGPVNIDDGPSSVPGVRHVIAVASGKGGVGKSTVSANLATALAARGYRVGLLDADVTGPNIPLMMGTPRTPIAGDGKMLPLVSHGVKVMSIGFFTEDDAPVIWRGTLVSRAVQQFLHEVEWGELDFLVVDLPPGTGDVPLTLARSIPISGTVIVTTPQDVALLDARKSLVMFRKLNVPVLGIVENMSYYVCHHCGERAEIFGNGGGERMSGQYGVDFLGRIPLNERVRLGADQGNPVALDSNTDGAVFLEIADKVAALAGSFCDACHSGISL
ncbi:MAG: Mrp/NBP35 family ATP-binding protein [Chloroflexi bacterium]|nr:Mrp/NBP35 family ATP-binding protein [Chloroflexota bacterium]